MESILPLGSLFFYFTRRISFALCGLLLLASPVFSADYYVSPTGSDANSGTKDRPFATVMRGQKAASPGDTVFLRGGTYAMTDNLIANQDRQYAYVNYLDKSGRKDAPIKYYAFPGEKPVFDFSKVRPAGVRITAFFIRGDWLEFKGFEVTGVQVTVTGHTQSESFRCVGSNNKFEQLSMHDSMAIGFYLTAGANNLVLNCDAYRNWDNYSEGIKGGNTDGFGCHPTVPTGIGNVFRGCRSWFNSDDGYDCINAHALVLFDHCWAMYNGYSTDYQSLGDGNGFKDGGYGARLPSQLPVPIPHHTVQFCLSVGNKNNGFYSNHHIGANNFYSNTAYKNGVNFNFLCRLGDNVTDVPGYGQDLKNNLGYKGKTEVLNLGTENNSISHNYFDLKLDAKDDDFLSLDETQLTQPRQANGDLPEITFMHLKDTSKFVDAGLDRGTPFNGKAPDLGCFESGTPTKDAKGVAPSATPSATTVKK